MKTPKVSIVIPIYNVEKYLRQCLDSVINQTLKDIEVICVNDGSTDGSLRIIQEYMQMDPRVKVIDKPNSGYGNSMNRGFDMACGEYIGIVESDDYADLDMFEKLYNCAKVNRLDVVKSGFYFYYSIPEEKNIPAPVASQVMCSRVFCPTTDFRSAMEQAEFFNIKPSIWSAIYRREFIRENAIRFHETPGASYQDASFNFKVWCCAKRAKLMEECFLHYRQDNETSSINSPGKVYCIADEYEEMERFLKEHPVLKGKMEGIRLRLKYDSYIWNYERLSEPLQREFIKFASQDFKKDMLEGYCEKKYFPWYKWNMLEAIIRNPELYHKWRLAEKEGAPFDLTEELYGKESFGQKLRRKWRGAMDCYREHGFIYTLKNLFGKVKRKVLGV